MFAKLIVGSVVGLGLLLPAVAVPYKTADFSAAELGCSQRKCCQVAEMSTCCAERQTCSKDCCAKADECSCDACACDACDCPLCPICPLCCSPGGCGQSGEKCCAEVACCGIGA
jgi:hypothetical protein